MASEDESEGYSIPIANRIKQSGITVVITLVGSVLGLAISYFVFQHHLDKERAKGNAEYDKQQKIEEILEKFDEFESVLLTIVEKQPEQDRKLEYAYNFSRCWPPQNCPDIPPLQVDTNQNAAIDDLYQKLADLDEYTKFNTRDVCQKHRDEEIAAGKAPKYNCIDK